MPFLVISFVPCIMSQPCIPGNIYFNVQRSIEIHFIELIVFLDYIMFSCFWFNFATTRTEVLNRNNARRSIWLILCKNNGTGFLLRFIKVVLQIGDNAEVYIGKISGQVFFALVIGGLNH